MGGGGKGDVVVLSPIDVLIARWIPMSFLVGNDI